MLDFVRIFVHWEKVSFSLQKTMRIPAREMDWNLRLWFFGFTGMAPIGPRGCRYG